MQPRRVWPLSACPPSKPAGYWAAPLADTVSRASSSLAWRTALEDAPEGHRRRCSHRLLQAPHLALAQRVLLGLLKAPGGNTAVGGLSGACARAGAAHGASQCEASQRSTLQM